MCGRASLEPWHDVTHEYDESPFSKRSTLEYAFENLRFRARKHQLRVDGSCIQRKKSPFPKIPGYGSFSSLSPHPLYSNFSSLPSFFLLNSFNMAPEIEFASLNFLPFHKTTSYADWEDQFDPPPLYTLFLGLPRKLAGFGNQVDNNSSFFIL